MRWEDYLSNHERIVTAGVTLASNLKSGVYNCYLANSCIVHIKMAQHLYGVRVHEYCLLIV
jgi:hypothetical protein